MRTLYIFILTLISLSSIAQCPFQIKDCKGKCPRFTDLNLDGYCDFTIITTLPPVVDTMVIRKDTHSTQIFASAGNDKHLTKGSSSSHPIRPGSVSSQIMENKNHNESHTILSNQQNTSTKVESQNLQKQKNISLQKNAPGTPAVSLYKRYSLFLISGLCLGLYIISFLLAKFKVIEIRIHRKIWNILLAITFLVTGLLGLFMVIQLNYSIQVKWFKPLLIWHVSFGIGMALISIFHFLWHWSYIKKIFNFRPAKSNN